MTHPVIPQIIDLATPIASQLGLEIVEVVFQTNKRPPVLRVDIRNLSNDTSLNDCEQMSRSLEAQLDVTELIPGSYVLEISSPGISRQLASERDFTVFKGFDVLVTTDIAFENHKEWRGKLQGRDEQTLYLNQKGRVIAIPRQIITKVQLEAQR